VAFFEFILIITSVIYALCMAPLLSGFVRILQFDGEIKYFLPHAAFSLYLFILVPLLWWTMWQFRDIDWHFATYFYMIIEPAIMFVACSLIIPQQLNDQNVDFEKHYFKVRVPLYISLFLLAVLVFADGVVFGVEAVWISRRPIQIFWVLIITWALLDRRKPAQYVAAFGGLFLAFTLVAIWFWTPAGQHH
jgi:hypothetical protein